MSPTSLVFDPSQMSGRDIYRLMIGTIVPRPIAWVSTLSRNGTVNLAPFSYFNGVTSRPPLVMLSIGQRRVADTDGATHDAAATHDEGRPRMVRVDKDTLRNIERTRELVIHPAIESQAEAVNASSAELPYGESELQRAGLHTAPSHEVAVPRVAECPVAMEARLHQIIRVGDHGQNALVLARIVKWHVEESVWDAEHGRVDVDKLAPLSRLGANLWGHTREVFGLQRPDW